MLCVLLCVLFFLRICVRVTAWAQQRCVYLTMLVCSSLKRAMRPSVLTQMTLTNGEIATFEVWTSVCPRSLWSCVISALSLVITALSLCAFLCVACVLRMGA